MGFSGISRFKNRCWVPNGPNKLHTLLCLRQYLPNPLQDVFGELVVVVLLIPMDSGGHGGDLMI